MPSAMPPNPARSTQCWYAPKEAPPTPTKRLPGSRAQTQRAAGEVRGGSKEPIPNNWWTRAWSSIGAAWCRRTRNSFTSVPFESYIPPEASMVAPVIYEASGESKNAPTAAISSGSASRPIALIDLITLSTGTPRSAGGI